MVASSNLVIPTEVKGNCLLIRWLLFYCAQICALFYYMYVFESVCITSLQIGKRAYKSIISRKIYPPLYYHSLINLLFFPLFRLISLRISVVASCIETVRMDNFPTSLSSEITASENTRT